MNVAIITAAGVGSRMDKLIPKQFIEIENKPLIIYTLQKFQNCNQIDSIILVCLDGWKDYMKELTETYNLTKVGHIVSGGKTGQDSIYNGLQTAKTHYDNDSIIIIHDGNRPLVSNDIIVEGINVCKKKGNAVAYVPCQEVMLLTDDKEKSTKQIDRSLLVRTQTPHVFRLDDLNRIFESANKENIINKAAVCSICVSLGVPVNLYLGSEKNIKITTKEDLEIFKALLTLEKDE